MSLDLSSVTFETNFDSPEKDDIIRCLTMLILTSAGTCPLYRDFGISIDTISLPFEVALSTYTVEVMEKAAKYEKRAIVREITFEPLSDGSYAAKVVLDDG